MNPQKGNADQRIKESSARRALADELDRGRTLAQVEQHYRALAIKARAAGDRYGASAAKRVAQAARDAQKGGAA